MLFVTSILYCVHPSLHLSTGRLQARQAWQFTPKVSTTQQKHERARERFVGIVMTIVIDIIDYSQLWCIWNLSLARGRWVPCSIAVMCVCVIYCTVQGETVKLTHRDKTSRFILYSVNPLTVGMYQGASCGPHGFTEPLTISDPG